MQTSLFSLIYGKLWTALNCYPLLQCLYRWRTLRLDIAAFSQSSLLPLKCTEEYAKYPYALCNTASWTGIKWAATWQNQQSKCAPSEDSDQPGHQPSLIRVFAVRMKKAWVLSYPLSAQQRLWSDWADAQAELSSLGAQPFCWFWHEAAQIWDELDFRDRTIHIGATRPWAQKNNSYRLIIGKMLSNLHLTRTGIKYRTARSDC